MSATHLLNKSVKSLISSTITTQPNTANLLSGLAFESSFQANLISTIEKNDLIVMSNVASCRVFGYTNTELTKKTFNQLFDFDDCAFRNFLQQRRANGHAEAVVTGIRKNGRIFCCYLTSAIFKDAFNNQFSVSTVNDISRSILKQKIVDIKKDRIIAANIEAAKLAQKKIDIENIKAISNNIQLAKTEQIEFHLEKDMAVAVTEAIEKAKESERSNLGKELHDNINQLLGASTLYLDLAKKGGSKRKLYLERSTECTLTAIEEIRKLSKGLSSNCILTLGLKGAIQRIITDLKEINGINITCSLETFEEEGISEIFKVNIFRIVQEQLNNILKHARATAITLELIQNKKSIVLVISDDGVGFNLNEAVNGIGIQNIVSRSIAFNGNSEFYSELGKGFKLKVTFPIL